MHLLTTSIILCPLQTAMIKNTGKSNNNVTAVIDIAVLNLCIRTVHWQCSVGTGYVFCGTLVCYAHVAYHFPRTVLISTARRSPTASVVMIASPEITNTKQELLDLQEIFLSALARNVITTIGTTASTK